MTVNNKSVIEHILLTLLLFFLPLSLLSQEMIKGVVKTSDDGSGVPNAHICLYSTTDRTMISYTFSETSGEFQIEIKENLKNGFILEVSLLGFEKYSRRFDNLPKDEFTISLNPIAFQINSITVKAPRVSMRGDTINYMTTSFAKGQDRSIGEVLRRLPGVVVEESGQIKYNDKPINALYVDGKNLLEGQYGIATNNIQPDLVTMIQIFENHQPVKVLKEHIFSENAAINLTIDPKAKSRWIGMADLSTGIYPILWNVRLSLFQFEKFHQSMILYRTNNTGNDISRDLTIHNLGSEFDLQMPDLSEQRVLNLSGAGSPPLSTERSLFNSSHLVSANLLLPVSEGINVTLRVGYLNGNKKLNSEQNIEYIIKNSNNILIQEKTDIGENENVPSFDLTLTSNRDKQYLQNRVFGKMCFTNSSGVVFGSKNIHQKLKQKQYDFAEIFTYMKPIGKSLLRINSKTQILSLPESLNITTDSIKQSLNLFQVKSYNNFSTQIKSGWFKPGITGGYNLLYQSIESDIVDSRTLPKIDGENLQKFVQSELFFTPAFRFEKEKVRFLIRVPLQLYSTSFSDEIIPKDSSSLFLRITPGVSLNYHSSQDWEANLNYSYGNTQSDIQIMNSSYIMKNYRTLTEGYTGIMENYTHIAAIRIGHDNPLKLINFGLSANYYYRTGGAKISERYEDVFSIRKLLPDNENNNSNLSFSANLSKSFFKTPLNLKLYITHSIGKSDYIQRGENVTITSKNWTFEPIVGADIGEGLNFNFKLGTTFSKRISNGDSNTANLFNCNPSLAIYIKLSEKIDAAINLDYYFNRISSDVKADNFFADLRLKYKLGRNNIELNWRNILNQKYYGYAVYSELSRIEKVYKIRPWNLMVSYSTGF
ncbi:MAG: carboxypeptidase-like regulatory domain-containing protein [Bacteroidales bacterium]